MSFFAASEAPPRPESMKFPVFSLLAGNLAFSETSSQLTPPSSGESRANLQTTSTFALSSQYRSPAPAPRSAALEVLPRDADWREILAPDIHTGLSRQPATASLRSTNRLISKP